MNGRMCVPWMRIVGSRLDPDVAFIHPYLLCHSTKPHTINFQIYQRSYPITTHIALICTLFLHCYPSGSNLYLSIIGTDVGQHRFRQASTQSSRTISLFLGCNAAASKVSPISGINITVKSILILSFPSSRCMAWHGIVPHSYNQR